MKTMVLKIDDLRTDFQPSENLIEETVLQWINRIEQGESIPPVYVRFDGRKYFLQDGFHRLEAAKRIGLREIKAKVRPGTLNDMEQEFSEYLKKVKESLQTGR